MRVIIGVLLAATLGGFVASATAAPSFRTPVAYAAYARLHAIARELDRAAIARHAPDASIDARIATLHREVDALAAARPAPVAASDLLPLRVLLHNIERQRTTAASTALLPAQRDAAQRGRFAVLDAAHGGTCESAYALDSNGEIDGVLPAAAVLWLRIDAQRADRIALTTAASPLATAIDVFDACPHDAAVAPRASAQGPGAQASAAAARALAVRIRNLGAAGEITVIAGIDSAIEGTITDASNGTPLRSAGVFALDAQGFVAYANTDFEGHYSIPVAAGSYAVLASMEHYVTEAWPDQPCSFVFILPTCIGGPPQTIDVAGVVTGIDIALGHGGTIAGHVREEGTNIVIDGGSVTVYDVDGYNRGVGFLDAAGRYAVDGLIAGTYRALASSYTNGSEVYDNIPCPNGYCDITNGTPITVAADAFVSDIDFSLPRAFYVSATVRGTDASTFASVEVVDSTGNIVAQNNTVPPNVATPVGPLSAGTYYVVARADYFIGQVFDHVDCNQTYCAFPYTGATPVVVSSATPTPSVAFDLHPLATVSGTITDATTHAALSGQVVILWSDSDPPYQLGGAISNFDGTYQVFGIPAGSVWVTVSSFDHRDTAYLDAACDDTMSGDIQGCDLAAATPVAVGSGASVTGIDVALPMNGSISGHVGTRGVDGHDLPVLGHANVRIFTPDGTPLTSSTQQGDRWIVSDLRAGSYLARVDVVSYYSQVWPAHDCLLTDDLCDPRVGTPIVVGDAAAVHGIDFDPVASLGIVGRVVDALTGRGVAGVGLDLWFGEDGTHCTATASDIDGYYLLDGSYAPCWFGGTVKVSTDAGAPFVDQLFDGVACPNGPAFLGLCPLAGATPIGLPATAPTPTIASFLLDRREGIFANGFD